MKGVENLRAPELKSGVRVKKTLKPELESGVGVGKISKPEFMSESNINSELASLVDPL